MSKGLQLYKRFVTATDLQNFGDSGSFNYGVGHAANLSLQMSIYLL